MTTASLTPWWYTAVMWQFSQTLLNKETAEENIFTTNRRDDPGDQSKIQTAAYWPKCPVSLNTQCLKHYHCSPCCVRTLINWDSSTPKSKQCSVDWGCFCSKSLGWWFCSVWLSVETVPDRAVKSGGTQVDCTHSFIQTNQLDSLPLTVLFSQTPLFDWILGVSVA